MAHDWSHRRSSRCCSPVSTSSPSWSARRAAPRLGAVRDGLTRAVALRARGDVPAATQAIAAAMQTLADLADALDPAEAGIMRAVAAQFGAATARGATAEMERTSELMRERSGAHPVPKK